jgi:hypothetical protein
MDQGSCTGFVVGANDVDAYGIRCPAQESGQELWCVEARMSEAHRVQGDGRRLGQPLVSIYRNGRGVMVCSP